MFNSFLRDKVKGVASREDIPGQIHREIFKALGKEALLLGLIDFLFGFLHLFVDLGVLSPAFVRWPAWVVIICVLVFLCIGIVFSVKAMEREGSLSHPFDFLDRCLYRRIYERCCEKIDGAVRTMSFLERTFYGFFSEGTDSYADEISAEAVLESQPFIRTSFAAAVAILIAAMAIFFYFVSSCLLG